jgi:Asp-tRNA(Asn)/Glu-tRNA(Gln) amidotransferase A subunit family amidase
MLNRRTLLVSLATAGIGTPTFHRALAQLASGQAQITPEMIAQASWVSGITLTPEEQVKIAQKAQLNAVAIEQLRRTQLDHTFPPATQFQTWAVPHTTTVTPNRNHRFSTPAALNRPTSDEALCFLPVSELSELIRTRQITSTELTERYLQRLKKYDPLLRCVVNQTEELAQRQAAQADREIAAGHYRGPLHGIPWGAKDLISIPSYPTTWGITVYRDRVLDETATVAERLQAAGAVLIAKLSLGAIAMGDQWFGQMTRNPWNPRNGSSGSSAGSAAATAAGCVGFSLGTETLGSILSPSIRCGATGLRPTFGRVSRHGCMPLAWSMDKVGPICRSVEDCAVVFGAIHGADGRDPTAVDRAFEWPHQVDLRSIRIGVQRRENQAELRDEERILKDLGCQLVPIDLPKDYPLRALTQAIDIEAAEIFQDLLFAGQTEHWNDWTDIFRAAHFISAVDYLKLMRVRRKLMAEMENVMKQVDVLFNCNDILHSNLSGHPSVVLPWKIAQRSESQRPVPATFTGQLFDESRLCAVAHAFQLQAQGHLQRPPLDAFLEQQQAGTLDAKPESPSPSDGGGSAPTPAPTAPPKQGG